MASWVFFDMDGTLIDSVPALYRSYARFLKAHGRRGTQEEFNELNGPSLTECVRILMERYSLKGSFEQNVKSYYSIVQVEAEKVDERPGAGDVLTHLKKNGHKLCLVTSATTPIASRVLKKAGWSELFDHLTCGEEVERGKPAPDIYELALRKAGCAAKDVLVIEDSPNGLQAARRAGLKAVHADVYFGKNAIVRSVWQGKAFSAKLIGAKPANNHNKIFSVEKIKLSRKQADLRGRFVDYQRFQKSVSASDPKNKINVLAVSGLAMVGRDTKAVYLIGQRSRHVSTYKNYWEFVPSGGVDGESLGPKDRISLRRTLLTELREESGLTPKDVSRIEALGLVYDSAVGAYDCGYRIRLKPSVLKIKKLGYNPREYSHMSFLSRPQLEKLFKTEKKIAPTSLLFWEQHLSSSNQKGHS